MATAPSSDSELIERIQRRDADALAEAYDKYGTAAFSILLRITHDRTAAEDLLQELFLRVWNRARYFDPARGSLGVWILAIARNMALDYVRSAHNRFSSRLRSIEGVDPLFLSRTAGQRDSLGAAELALHRRAITSALEALQPNERRALELAYFEGMSQSEISAAMQQPLGTVKSWIRSGLARLRLAMKAGVVA